MKAFYGTRAWLVLVLSMLLVAAGATAGTASNGGEHGKGPGIPKSKISVQLWTFAEYMGSGEEPLNQQHLEEALAGLSEIGYRNVEPFSFNGLSAEEFKALLRKYDLKAPSRHGDTNEATWDQHLADAKVLGQKFTGSGSFPAPGHRELRGHAGHG